MNYPTPINNDENNNYLKTDDLWSWKQISIVID